MKRKLLNIFLALACICAGTTLAYAAKNFNVLNGSNSYLFVNGTSGNVGISSTAPGQLLDVQGTVRATGFELTNNNATAGYILQASGSTGIGTWVPEPSPGGSNTQVQYNSSGSFAASSNFVFTGTNVGVGSNNPGQSLDVQGTVRAVGEIVNGNVGINSSAPGYNLDVNGGARIGGSGFSTFNTNVGIGSTAPGVSLDVQGGVRSSQVSGQPAGTMLCVRSDGTIGYCTSGTVTSTGCTCN